ncbi:hypothetical protein ACTND8_07890 [Atopobiaceae bacterium HCP3S3_F7]|jgi:metal-responsive CopG/Arc/MetJ family transcriptional regulator|uniref:hypothetical protein n=1 Tax=Bacillati TaxID=1783272 RepID=UPI003F88E326
MARPKNVVATKSINLTIPADLYEALDEYRWSVRKEFRDIVRDALTEYAAKHGAEVKATAPTK